MRLPSWLGQHLAALRVLLVFTAILGLAYPLGLTAVAQLPGLRDHANGSLVHVDGEPVGSRLIGQSFTDADGDPIPWYFQSRPSAASYDPTATSAGNLGPESVDLLNDVCARSLAIGELEGVNGRRPFCTDDGVGAVLRVFYSEGLTGSVTRVVSVNQPCPATPFVTAFRGTAVECAVPDEDYSRGVLTPIRGAAPAAPVVPADAVTASGSGLDPHISVAYARLQVPRIARERDAAEADVRGMIEQYTDGRALGFMGEPGVNVLELNLALDRRYPTG